eukprot:10627154-Karenia_brevis.AAC.1
MCSVSSDVCAIKTEFAAINQRVEVLAEGLNGLGLAIKNMSGAVLTQGQNNAEHLLDGNKVLMAGIFDVLKRWTTTTKAAEFDKLKASR